MEYNLLKERTWAGTNNYIVNGSPISKHINSTSTLSSDPNVDNRHNMYEWLELSDFFR